MSKLKLLLCSVAAVAIVAANVESGRACSCLPPPPPAQAFAEADAVFMGKVVSFELTGDAYSPRLAKFAVTKIWKGELDAVSEILTANNSAACGYYFQVGESYLIYAYKADDGKLHTNLCTRTQPVALAADDLKYLESTSIFPLGLGNAWTLVMKQAQIRYTDTIKDSSRIDGKLYFRFEHFREFNNVWLRLAADGKLYMRLDTTEQVWLDFGAQPGDKWPVVAPNKLATWTVQLVSTTDTVKTVAGTFAPCYRFHFTFPGADNDWDEWFAFGVGTVRRLYYGIALFDYTLENAIIDGVPTAVDDGPVHEPIRYFDLQQNYPNPFAAVNSANTVIRYRLIEAAPVKLSIYDVLGREIKTLAQHFETAGEHTVAWDGLNFAGEKAPSGIYFYRLQMGKHVEVRKIILTR